MDSGVQIPTETLNPLRHKQPSKTTKGKSNMASKAIIDDTKQVAADVDCGTVARMSLSELLYHALTREGSPFQIASGAKAA